MNPYQRTVRTGFCGFPNWLRGQLGVMQRGVWVNYSPIAIGQLPPLDTSVEVEFNVEFVA